MAVVTRKSAFITNLDAVPPVNSPTGEGAPGFTRVVNDQLTTVAADSIASLYRLVRFPANAKVKQVVLTSAATVAAAGDVSVMYSDSTTDGTPINLAVAGVVLIAGNADNKLFGVARSLISIVDLNITYLATFTRPHSNLPMWQVLVNLGSALVSSQAPIGYNFDLGIKLTTAIGTGGVLAMECWYVE